INSSRFLSFFDRMRLGMILKNDEMFFVSSDMHNMVSRRNTMKTAYTTAKKYFKDKADELFCYNAARYFNIDINAK
ncbi:MAG: hypothetical protein IKV97_05020, partial [Clostridia bacterium]|nr:hypothetical protein [Clostridia bacterium]